MNIGTGWRCIVVLALLALSAAISRANETADLVLLAAKAWTGENDAPWAMGVAIRKNLIVAVGDRLALKSLQGPETRVIEIADGFITP